MYRHFAVSWAGERKPKYSTLDNRHMGLMIHRNTAGEETAMSPLENSRNESKHVCADVTKQVPNKGMSRRGFFKLAGIAVAAGAASVSLPKICAAKDLSSPLPYGSIADDKFWRNVQNQFSIDPNVVYMNIGTTGSTPKAILESYSKYNELAAYHPRTFEAELGATLGLPAQREALAVQFGCNMDEICLSHNTTDGLDTIINGLDFQRKDEILITHHEHIGALSPLHVLRDRYGVIIKEVEIPVLKTESADQFVESFRNNISKKTKAILFSHITYKTGTRLPARELCTLAREHGLISIVDGAHGPGMIQLDFHDMGCDFYAGAGHKWQCGPGGTGILYLRNQGENLPKFWTQNASTYTFAVEPYGNKRGAFDIAYSLQYRGQGNIAAFLATVDACNMWEEIGRDKIEEYVCGLGSYLKKGLKEKFGGAGTFFAPDIPEFATGLTSFNPFDDIHDSSKIMTLVDRLAKEAGYQVRYTDFYLHVGDIVRAYALRISTHLFHNRTQIDGLIDALYNIYLEMEG